MAGQLWAQLARALRQRHADQGITRAELLDEFMAQIVLGPHQPVALITSSLPVQQESGREVGPIEQRERMVFALQLRCQAQLAAVHAAEFGIEQLVVMGVHQTGGTDLRPGQGAVLGAATAQLRAVVGRVRSRPHHTIDSQYPQRAGVRWSAAPGPGQQTKQAGQRLFAQALAGLHAGTGRGQRLPIQTEIELLDNLPQRPIAKQRQSDHQPDGVFGRQFASSDRGLAGGCQCLLNAGGVDQCAEFIKPLGDAGQGLAQCALKQAHQAKKGNVWNTFPFYRISCLQA